MDAIAERVMQLGGVSVVLAADVAEVTRAPPPGTPPASRCRRCPSRYASGEGVPQAPGDVCIPPAGHHRHHLPVWASKKLVQQLICRQNSANTGPVNALCLQCICNAKAVEVPIPQEVPAKRPCKHLESPMGRN